MNRSSVLVVAASFVVLVLLATPAEAQHEEINAIQQHPQSEGFLERIMSDYVYPIRDYDWRGMVRRFLNGVMDYLAPDAKQPKVGGPYHPAQDRAAVFVRNILNRAVHYVDRFLA